MSNPKPIDQAVSADLRSSHAALLRAARRAREIAAQTGTAIVVWHDGALEYINPAEPAPVTAHAGEPGPKLPSPQPPGQDGGDEA